MTQEEMERKIEDLEKRYTKEVKSLARSLKRLKKEKRNEKKNERIDEAVSNIMHELHELSYTYDIDLRASNVVQAVDEIIRNEIHSLLKDLKEG